MAYTRLNEIYDHVTACIPRPLYMMDMTLAVQPLSSVQRFNGSPETTLSYNYNVQGVYLKDMQGRAYQNGNQPIRVFLKITSTTAKGDLSDDFVNYFFVGYERSFGISRTGIVMINERD